MLVILLLTRRMANPPKESEPPLDYVGAVLSAVGLGLIVYGVLRSGEWGWIQPKPGGTSWAGLSPTVWLILGGLFVLWIFIALAGAAGGARRGAAGAPRDAAQSAADRRPADVLLPVPGAGRAVLRGAAVPVGLPRPVGDRHRRADPAAVGDAARCCDRDPAAVARRVAATGGAGRAAGDAGRDGGAARRARRRGRGGDRAGAAAAGRARHRRARLPARRRHGLRRARRPRAARSAASRTR